jgi:hypothetical protein
MRFNLATAFVLVSISIALQHCGPARAGSISEPTVGEERADVRWKRGMTEQREELAALQQQGVSTDYRRIEKRVAELKDLLPPITLQRIAEPVVEGMSEAESIAILGKNFELHAAGTKLVWETKNGERASAEFQDNNLIHIVGSNWHTDGSGELWVGNALTRRLRLGMSMDEARSQLGKPQEIEPTNRRLSWKVPSKAQEKPDEIMIVVKDGKVCGLTIYWSLNPPTYLHSSEWGVEW